ncbi:hypothetical protein PMAYCL1PPCAC_13251, partial [Pristionchus mayeri]
MGAGLQKAAERMARAETKETTEEDFVSPSRAEPLQMLSGFTVLFVCWALLPIENSAAVETETKTMARRARRTTNLNILKEGRGEGRDCLL